ncbi:MAG: phospholipid/cholesterol/gamma-HCH transport system substrate-binding protein, partial [Pseudonocardiales bacterium]|nr:phospholipid/cholesterol/gamma-HCH transport system substrate-binding protein [Pseudonocardiales bacterium]
GTHVSGLRVTAYFTNASALFPDNQVMVLGVPVGTIDAVTPERTQVRVDMTITDPDVRLPADAKAAVVSPSLVTGRYVQLLPPYTGGPELAEGAVIPLSRTAVPLGVDDLARTATQLAQALGPNGANKNGAVSDVLTVGARNLDGNGQAVNDTIRGLGDLSGTLSGSSEDLFGTVSELETFTSALAKNDDQVRTFNGRLADVSGFLAGQRGELGDALAQLATALGDVAAFVKDNRGALRHDVDGLTDVTATLVDQQKALTEVLDVAPAATSNLINTYNGSSGTLDTRPDINELANPPLVTLCKLLGTPGAAAPPGIPASVTDACSSLSSVVSGAAPLPSAADVLTALYGDQPLPVPGLALPLVAGPGPGVGSTPPASRSTVPQPPSAKTAPAPTGSAPDAPALSPLLSLLGGGR